MKNQRSNRRSGVRPSAKTNKQERAPVLRTPGVHTVKIQAAIDTERFQILEFTVVESDAGVTGPHILFMNGRRRDGETWPLRAQGWLADAVGASGPEEVFLSRDDFAGEGHWLKGRVVTVTMEENDKGFVDIAGIES